MSLGPYLLLLPEVAMEKIFSFLTFNEISKCREVCTKLDAVCGKLLSRGFVQAERRHAAMYKRMKTMLPRRESERRTHPLARHCEILSAVDTRISMLNMTFSRYIEPGLCCFIPGKVVDEIERVLNVTEQLVPPPRPQDLLQELRDLSSMAIEHFEEYILPDLKARMDQASALTFPSMSVKPGKFVLLHTSVVEDMKKINRQNKYYKLQLTQILSQMEKLNRRGKRQQGKLKAHFLKIRDQDRQLSEQSARIREQENVIGDLRKHLDDYEQKFAELSADVRANKVAFAKAKSHAVVVPPILPPLPSARDAERKRKCCLPSDVPPKLARSETIKTEEGNVKKEESFEYKLWNKSLEMLIKNPLTCIKSRKRKMQEDIDLNN